MSVFTLLPALTYQLCLKLIILGSVLDWSCKTLTVEPLHSCSYQPLSTLMQLGRVCRIGVIFSKKMPYFFHHSMQYIAVK